MQQQKMTTENAVIQLQQKVIFWVIETFFNGPCTSMSINFSVDELSSSE